jgi:hypothetical protein
MGEFENELQPKIDECVLFSRGLAAERFRFHRRDCLAVGLSQLPIHLLKPCLQIGDQVRDRLPMAWIPHNRQEGAASVEVLAQFGALIFVHQRYASGS